MTEFDPDWVVAPGETLDDWFRENRLPLSAADRVGIGRQKMQRILAGTEPIGDDLAERLCKLTGIRVEMWLALERNFREGLAAGKKWSGSPDAR